MIRGYVSSDEDDYDDYDFGYSEPLIREKKEACLPQFQTQEAAYKLNAFLKEKEMTQNFFIAVDEANLNALEECISEGTLVDTVDSQNWTALLKACGMGKPELVRFLLEKGADPNKHRELLTPLIMCCTDTSVDEELKLRCLRHLLEFGANANAKDKFRTTPLMYACGSGYGNIANTLLEVPEIDVNIQDSEGWTALFYAVKCNNLQLVEKLVQAKTNLKFKDKYGRTAVNLAVDKNYKTVATALGYVEEVVPVSNEKKEPKDRFLDELPGSNGKGGFFDDARNILKAFKQKNVKEISLSDLLNANNEDLYAIGVKLQPDRNKILTKGIHRYHLHPWKIDSMQKITPGTPMSLEDAITLTGSFARHLTIANASLRYVSTRISSRQNNESIDLYVEKEIIITLISSYEFVDLMNRSLSSMRKSINKIKPDIPSDYIFPYKKSGGSKLAKYCFCIFGTATAGILFYKSDFFSRRLFKFFVNTFPSFLELFTSDYYCFN